MPSTKTRKRRRRRKASPPWGPLLGALLAVNLALGFCFSPMTSLRKVRVVSALPGQQEEVRKALKELEGIPYCLIHRGWLENKLTLTGTTSLMEMHGNVFGRAVVTLTPRSPVAVLTSPESAEGLSLDESGRVFATEIEVPGLPKVAAPAELVEVTPSIAQPLEAKTLATVASLLSANWPQDEWTLTLEEDSSLTASCPRGSKSLGVLVDPADALPLLADAFGAPPSAGSQPPPVSPSTPEAENKP